MTSYVLMILDQTRLGQERGRSGESLWAGRSPAEFAPGPQGGADGAVVKIIQLAADRYALGKAGDLRRSARQSVGDIMRRGLAVDGRVQRQNNLTAAFIGHPCRQTRDAQFLWSNRIQRGKCATQNVIAPLEGLPALHRPKVSDIFHHTNFARGAGRVGTDRA